MDRLINFFFSLHQNKSNQGEYDIVRVTCISKSILVADWLNLNKRDYLKKDGDVNQGRFFSRHLDHYVLLISDSR